MFKPHSTLPPIVHPVDPQTYRQFGHKDRGNPGRTMCQSDLKEFGRCAHRWVAGFDEEKTSAMADGALVDCVILTPERFEKTYAIAPETYPAEGKKKGDPTVDKPWNWNATFCKEWRDEQTGKGLEVAKSDDASEAWKAKEAFFQNDHLRAFHEVSKKQAQVNVEWHDQSGIVVPVKCLLDIVPDPSSQFGDTLADLKRTNCADYRSWAKTVHSYGLHYQGAFYLDAINAATGLNYRNFEHHIQESFSPYETTWRPLSVEFIKLGRDRYQYDLREYCRSLNEQKFHGYDNAVVDPEPYMIAAL